MKLFIIKSLKIFYKQCIRIEVSKTSQNVEM